MAIRTDVTKVSRDFVRRGGKQNRRKQFSRMLSFAAYCEARCPGISLAQVGGRHVIGYYKSLQHLSWTTREAHYYAIASLFQLAGKSSPPRPFKNRKIPNSDEQLYEEGLQCLHSAATD